MTHYQRSSQDIGNIVALEHVNLKVPSQETATAFYVSALGLTRDPHMNVGTSNMWINIGRQQFHLPRGAAQKFNGTIGVRMPDQDALLARLEQASAALTDTQYRFAILDSGVVQVVCPWGNRFEVTESTANQRDQFKITQLVMPVAKGSAEAIVALYRDGLGAIARVIDRGDDHSGSRAALVTVGAGQSLIYQETQDTLADWDGHHIAIYVANFSQPHEWLNARGLISREDNEHQYRFCTLGESASESPLYRLEHEVRSLHHPLFNRRLVNRLDLAG